MSTNPLAVPESQPTAQPETGALGRMTGVIVSPTTDIWGNCAAPHVGVAVRHPLRAEYYCLGTARPENGLAQFF